MIHVRKITITRVEGPTHLCDKPVEFIGQDVFNQVRKYTDYWDSTYPELGYDKHDFEIVWADGEVYTGRLDCTRANGTDKNSLSKHIKGSLAYYYEHQKEGNSAFSVEKIGDIAAFMKDRVGFFS